MDSTADRTDDAVLRDLGERLARHRLDLNLTQEALAREAGLSERTLHRIEHGHSTNLVNLIRLLRALDLLENLEVLVPDPAIRPMQRLRLQGKARRRASSVSKPPAKGLPWSWGDEE